MECSKKASTYIYKAFNGDLKAEIDESLKDNVSRVDLIDMMTFDRVDFDKVVNVRAKKKVKIESKWNLVTLDTIAKIDWGNTNLTKESYKQHAQYKAYSAAGQDGMIDFAEHEGKAIVLSAIGARCGKCFKADGKWTAIKNTIVIKGNNEILTDYLYECINDENYWARSGKAQPFITLTSARGQKIPLPPLEVQQKIIDEIEEIEKENIKNEKIVEELKKNTDILINAVLETKKYKLGQILTLEYGKALPKTNRINGIYPVVGSNGIDGYHNEYMLNAPNIIVGRKGSVGKVNWIEENCTPIDTCFYVKANIDFVDFKYCYYLLKNIGLESLNVGLGPGGLNRNTAYNIEIALPPLSDQQKIVSQIEQLEAQIREAQEKINNSKQQKQEILDKYLK